MAVGFIGTGSREDRILVRIGIGWRIGIAKGLRRETAAATRRGDVAL
jgi:hypothetical protein